MSLRRVTALALGALVSAMATGCGGDDNIDAESPPGPVSAVSADAPYTSRTFVVPLTVTPLPGLTAPPIDASNLISWDSGSAADDKVRFLLPVELYRPGKTAPEPPPADLAPYVASLATHGVTIEGTKKIEVGGKRATVATVTRAAGGEDVDGSLGCSVRGDDRADDCYAPREDLVLRLAVIDNGDKDVLAWARVPAAHPDHAFLDAFDKMLGTVQFR